MNYRKVRSIGDEDGDGDEGTVHKFQSIMYFTT